MSWADEYLKLLKAEALYCVPIVDLPAIASALDIPLDTLRSRRAYRDDVRKMEKVIQAEHLGRLRAEALAGTVKAAEEARVEEEEEDLPLALERYLEVYRELDDRLAAVRKLQAEGIEIDLDDVLQAMQSIPAFDRAMRRLWEEGNIEAEDANRRRARSGRSDAATQFYLRANMSHKYGNKVDVAVRHTHQLDDADRELIDTIKQKIDGPVRPRLIQSDEIVGEVLGETPS